MYWKSFLTLFAALLVVTLCTAQPFTLVGKDTKATIVVSAKEPVCVKLAVADLVSDVRKITGRVLSVETPKPGKTYRNAVLVSTSGLSELPLADKSLPGRWEAYSVRQAGGNLLISGSDERGTMFGIYHFIEQYLGVDPLYFWNDREPAKRAVLSWSGISISRQSPTFRYRGWFINDEDLLTEWRESTGRRNIDYPFYGQVVAPQTMRSVVEALVRLRQNLLIPASFIDIRNPAEAALVEEAARRGVFVSMHHVEPMGVSAFAYFNYWKEKTGEKPVFSFFSQREKVEEVWRVYAREWARYPNVIWQIGLRGIADRPMWLADPGIPQTDAERGKLISEAMLTQLRLIKEIDKRKEPVVTTTLWAEGAVLNAAGHLKIPEGVTLIFADNSPGWKMPQDFYETPRRPENHYGIYYHHQLWGWGPHLVQIVPPRQTYAVFGEALQKGDTAYVIQNVSNIREFVLGIDQSARMTWNMRLRPEQLESVWFGQRFGDHAESVQRVYKAYFESFVIDSRTKTPALMDGIIAGQGAGILQDIRTQLKDSSAYARRKREKAELSEEAKWAKAAFASIGTTAEGPNALLLQVQQQRKGHLKADSLARALLPALTASQTAVFETNLLSQLQLILGLETWLEAVLQAKLALDNGRHDEAKAQLQTALSAFERIKKGQAMNVKNPKWQHWYRGEKKMNLTQKESLTSNVLHLL